MATIKSYSDLQQSRKLAEILPLESADACWTNHMFGSLLSSWRIESTPPQEYKSLLDRFVVRGYLIEPAWSLTALLNVLPDGTDIIKDKTDTENEKYMCTVGVKDDIICTFRNNPIDACVAMIEKLNELNLL